MIRKRELQARYERAKMLYEPRSTLQVKDSGEELVDQSEIEASGIVCAPFWRDPQNVEGDAFLAYIRKHPGFSLSVRRSVFKRLVQARDLLPERWQLVVKAGYRPLEVQYSLLNGVADSAAAEHPDWTREECLKHAQMYVSDPRLKVPPHTTGGAVDIDVIDTQTGQPVDFGCLPNTDSEIAWLFNTDIGSTAVSNRHTLLEAMLTVGFAPLYNEWWHYQYGETYWATFYGKTETLYGIRD